MPLPKPAGCQGCEGLTWACPTPGFGFTRQQTSSQWNGVLLVFEASGEHEAETGVPLQGKAGQAFEEMLQRGGMNRVNFDIANVLSCRPPNNFLTGAPYEYAVIQHCAPYLDAFIEARRPRCIVAGGAVALRRLLPNCPVGIDDARGYVHQYQHKDGWKTWLVPTIHPSRIARGQTSLTAVFLHDVTKAVEVARDGFAYLDTSFFVLDPTPEEVERWVTSLEVAVALKRVLHLSSDIETPDKDANEDELEEAEEDVAFGEPDMLDRSYTIIRCGYSYHDTSKVSDALPFGTPHVLSMPWGGPYERLHRRLIKIKLDHLWFNKSFDVPRVIADDKMPGGVQHDAMEAWHILNSDLRKSLGHVSSFLMPRARMWKHLSYDEPAWYNGMDAYCADVDMLKIIADLKKHGLWPVYVGQILEMDPIWSSMTAAGMPIDPVRRLAFSKELTAISVQLRADMQAVVPQACRSVEPKDGYKKALSQLQVAEITERLDPGEQLVEWLFDAVEKKRCPKCLTAAPKKLHFKPWLKKVCGACNAKWTKAHTKKCPTGVETVIETNPCLGLEAETYREGTTRWARVQPFTPSPKQILAYMTAKGHAIQYTGKGAQRKPTTNIKALKKIRAKQSGDPLYALIMDDRKITKLKGTYIGTYVSDEKGERVEGGFPVGKDGRVRAQFTNAPSTLRTSMRSPNLQNLPR